MKVLHTNYWIIYLTSVYVVIRNHGSSRTEIHAHRWTLLAESVVQNLLCVIQGLWKICIYPHPL